MAGGLVQLVYIGNSDKVLTQFPHVTFFKITYCRHTAHSIQDFIIKPESSLDMATMDGNRISEFVLAQNADLVFRPWLRITLPDIEATYEHKTDYYVEQFLKTMRTRNVTSNIILSSLKAMLYNYLKSYSTIYIDDNTSVSFNYEHHNFGANNRITGIPVINDMNPENTDSYSQLIKCDVIDNELSIKTDRYMYYASHNANYLTNELAKLKFSDEIIFVDDDFYESFRTNLQNYITGDNETKFVYSILNNKSPNNTGFTNKNETKTIIDELTYSLEYLYSNMKMLFIYNNNLLKCMYYVSSFSYSSKKYVNKVSPVNNLYVQLDDLITNPSNNLFISNGFNSNKTYNIHLFSATKMDAAYDISSSIVGDSNCLYFVYMDNTSEDQGKTFGSNSPGTEDYFDLYYNEPNNSNNKMFGPNDMLLPLCVLTYNSNTGYYDQVTFNYEINDQDMIYVYKDVLVFNQSSQKIDYALIGNTLHEIVDEHSYDISTNVYSDNINLGKSKIIDQGIIRSFESNEIEFLISNNDDGVILIDGGIHIGKDYISPFQIQLDISSNVIDRMIPVISVSNTKLNLDSFVNTNYILNDLKDYNIAQTDKLQTLYQNIINTKSDNLIYIKNVFEAFLNVAIYYKFYNVFSYKQNIETITMSINPRMVTNMLSYINTIGINGTDRYYSGMQNSIGNAICTYIDGTDVLHTENMRSISKLTDKLSYINLISNIQLNTHSQHIPVSDVSQNYAYVDASNNVLLSKLVFQVSSDYANMETVLEDLSLNLAQDSGYYYVENMLYSTTDNNGNITIQLTPATELAARQYYVFNMFFNASAKGEIFPFTSFYLLPNNLGVGDVTLSSYIFTVNRSAELPGIYVSYDTITNNNSVHYTAILYANKDNVKPRSIETKYILYDYAQSLYFDIKSRIPIDVSDTNLFCIYNDMKMHENLLHFRKMIFKNYNNGNVTSFIDLNAEGSGTAYYLDCNICMTDYLDHVIINNGLRQNIEQYLIEHVKPLVSALLIKIKGVLNFYDHSSIIGFYDTGTDISSTDIDVTHLDGLSVIKWYLFCMNAVKSDILGYVNNFEAIQIMTNISVGEVTGILDYIDTSSNFYSGSYLGTKLSIDATDFENILKISKFIRHLIDHIRATINDRIIDEGNGIVNVYTSSMESNIIDKKQINEIQFERFINVFPQLYGYNFLLQYKYRTQVEFFNTYKQNYLNFYKTLLNILANYGSYSYNTITNIKQFLNFDINDYILQMDWLSINRNYDTQIMFLFTGTISTDLDDKYKYYIVNNVNNIYTTALNTTNQTIISNEKQFVIDGRRLLDIKFKNLIDLIKNFNSFFSYNHTFYSDYRLIYVLYFYFYKTFTFSTYTLTFDKTNNTSSNNKISDGSNTYPYSWISFDISDNIRYIDRNNKMYDLSENTSVNYYVTPESINNSIVINCDSDPSYSVIGYNIVDLSENHVYTIRTSKIYEKSVQVGQIYKDEYGFEIYDISGVLHKYEVLTNKKRILLPGYRTITIQNNTITIDSNVYNIQYNTFHDSNYDIQFKFILPFLSNPNSSINSTNLYPIIVTNSTQYQLIPECMYDSTVNIDKVFKESFSTDKIKRSIKYLQDTVNETMYTTNSQHVKTIKTNSVPKLLHNICKNGILPIHNYIEDTLITCNYNNWLKSHNISEIIELAKQYKTPNKLMIFNETKQTSIELDDLLEEDLSDNIYFVASRLTNCTDETIPGKYVNSIDIMLNDSKTIKSEGITVDYTISNKIKEYIMDNIILDISNSSVSDIYNSGTYFDVSTNVIHSDDISLINSYSYFIRNSVIISKDEYDAMDIFTDGIHNFVYQNGAHIIFKSGVPYLIETVPKLENYDISYNNCKLSFNGQIVKIDVTDSIFPKSCKIIQGKLFRLDTTDQEFYIDSSGDLRYNYSYDISMHQMLQITKSFNDQICCDKSSADISGYVTDTIVSSDISIIYDTVNRFIILDSSINIVGQTIMICNNSDTVLSYVMWQDGNTIKITTDFVFPIDTYVTIKLDTPTILKHTGYDLFWYKTVFYFYETMINAYTQLNTYIDIKGDAGFKGQKFSCNNYINNLYGNLHVTINKSLFESDLFPTLAKRDKLYNLSAFNQESIQTMYDNLLSLKNTHHKNVISLQNVLARDPIPKCNWIDYVGNFIVDKIRFNMGSEIIEEINDYIVHTYYMRGLTTNLKEAYDELIGHNTYLQVPQQYIVGRVLYVAIPMCFTDCTNALPLLALINTRLSLWMTCNSLDKLLKFGPGIKLKLKKKFKLELNASYVFLEQPIREKFARSRHEYLVQTKQYHEYSIEKQNDEIALDYGNPCKEMMWFYMDQKIRDSKDYWNFTGTPIKLYNNEFLRYTCFDQNDEIRKTIIKMLENRSRLTGFDLTSSKTDLPIHALSHDELQIVHNLVKNTLGKKRNNPFARSRLDFNGQNRFDMEGDRSNLVESSIFLNECYVPGLNIKSFGRVTEMSHMGSLNFSNAHDMHLEYELNCPGNGSIIMITNTYQIIRIASGFGSKLWK